MAAALIITKTVKLATTAITGSTSGPATKRIMARYIARNGRSINTSSDWPDLKLLYCSSESKRFIHEVGLSPPTSLAGADRIRSTAAASDANAALVADHDIK